MSCAATTELCCGRPEGINKLSYKCEPSGLVACAGGIAIRCDDQTDCPSGQVCCGTLENNSGYTSVSCKAACTTVTPALRSVRFCDHNAAVDECVAIGMTCGASQSLPGYFVCKN